LHSRKSAHPLQSLMDEMATRWTTGLMDALQLLGLVLSVPIAILLVGAPIAMAIALLLWLARLAGGAS
jgi:hypothetical protein